jgi:ribosomal 50S subunit-recycling heat shock protein
MDFSPPLFKKPGLVLRVDLFLKLMGVTKTRMSAKHLCDGGKVILKAKSLKPSFELEGGESLEIWLPQKQIRLEVLGIPPAPTLAKKDRPRFGLIETLQER